MSTWAKSNAHFFFLGFDSALYRLPLDDIAQGEQIVIPSGGWIEVVGINEHYLFLSQRSSDWDSWNHDIYRISLSTLHTEHIDSGVYYGAPIFHPASNSIIFTHANFEEGKIILESLRLDTDIRNTFFEYPSDNISWPNTLGWLLMECDAVMFVNGVSMWGMVDYIFIDSELQAKQIASNEINCNVWQPLKPQNPAEEFISELTVILHAKNYATIDNYVFYLWNKIYIV